MIRTIKIIIAYLYCLRVKIILNKKINHIYHNLHKIINVPEQNVIRHREIWRPLNRNVNPKWYSVFASINKNFDPRYISEYDYYINVEPRLNQKGFSEAYSDKNIYYKNIESILLPDTYLRNMEGVFYTKDYQLTSFDISINRIPISCEKLIVKKSTDSGGGEGVELFNRVSGNWYNKNSEPLTLQYLNRHFSQNYLLQEYIIQHDYFSQFNNSSVNTVRLFTYRSVGNNAIYPLQAVLRIGKENSIVDNQASGGIACGIKNGRLNSFAVNKNGDRIYSVNEINFSEVEPVYKYFEIEKTGVLLAQNFYYHRLLGFDFSVDSFGKIKLIEINNKNNETNFFQMNSGPLFGDFTDEVIKYCTGKKKGFNFDFNL